MRQGRFDATEVAPADVILTIDIDAEPHAPLPPGVLATILCRDGRWRGRLLVPVPRESGLPVDGLCGRWLTEADLLVTAVAVVR